MSNVQIATVLGGQCSIKQAIRKNKSMFRYSPTSIHLDLQSGWGEFVNGNGIIGFFRRVIRWVVS